MRTFTPRRRYRDLQITARLALLERLYTLSALLDAGVYFLDGRARRMRDAQQRLVALYEGRPVGQWTAPHG